MTMLGWTLASHDRYRRCLLEVGRGSVRWRTESLLGRYSPNAAIATACCWPEGGHGDAHQGEGLSREWITTEIENSLRRLTTDYLDLYSAAADDDSTPLDETMEAFDRLISEGKVRNIGASNYDGSRLVSALGAARDLEVPRYEVLQPFYNLYDRFDFEQDLAEICIEHDLGVTPYFSLASGFLTGKYRSRAEAEGRRGRHSWTSTSMRVACAFWMRWTMSPTATTPRRPRSRLPG